MTYGSEKIDLEAGKIGSGLTKREHFALTAMAQLIAVRKSTATVSEIKGCVGLAVDYADELIKKLNVIGGIKLKSDFDKYMDGFTFAAPEPYWDECFITGEVGESDPINDFRLCGSAMAAWGNFHMGHSLPDKFHEAMAKLAERFGVADTHDLDALTAWIDANRPAMLAAKAAQEK